MCLLLTAYCYCYGIEKSGGRTHAYWLGLPVQTKQDKYIFKNKHKKHHPPHPVISNITTKACSAVQTNRYVHLAFPLLQGRSADGPALVVRRAPITPLRGECVTTVDAVRVVLCWYCKPVSHWCAFGGYTRDKELGSIAQRVSGSPVLDVASGSCSGAPAEA